jgi:hypothetical protein
MAMISVNRQVTQCTSPRLIAVNARHRQYWQSKLSIAAKRRAAMRIEVESTNNPKGELAPAKFRLDGVDIGVVEILEQWPGGHDHFFLFVAPRRCQQFLGIADVPQQAGSGDRATRAITRSATSRSAGIKWSALMETPCHSSSEAT